MRHYVLSWVVSLVSWVAGTAALVVADAAATDLVLTGSGVAALLLAAVKLLSDHRLVTRTIEDRDRTIADLRGEVARLRAEVDALHQNERTRHHE